MNPYALGLVAAGVLAAASGQLPAAQPPTAQPPGAQPPGQWPVQPVTVVEGFEPHDRFGAGHRGVDLAAMPGQVVRSALPGEVTFTGEVAGRSAVVVRHRGGVRTTYLPVTPTVAGGMDVSSGTVLGHVDGEQHCGLSTCLHWGARHGDDYIDPLSLLERAGPIVLLPLS